MEVIGDRVVVDLARSPFLRADGAGEIAEMVDRQRQSAAIVSRIGLPLSQVSAVASISRLASMRSAILLRMLARSAGLVRPQASLAAWAASSAGSMSAASERAISQTGWPVIGEMLSKYLPAFGRAPFAADVVAVALGERRFESDIEFDLGHGLLP